MAGTEVKKIEMVEALLDWCIKRKAALEAQWSARIWTHALSGFDTPQATEILQQAIVKNNTALQEQRDAEKRLRDLNVKSPDI
ncbi:hypothetical protein Z517_09249 [Fonsecaea pedrosoi CBS 271.37]|uniref:Uncharacterized protein n=1 Tax=Fonsecaea pedrosoi CBS 271.37 TaxID=1442368 RepID=A0A0D2GDN6_9EURO|nr:uncharacterized protein Z517_09249 [Fonsecaea pedrosoi CBS 271.37]KIW76805.1 hypothetical protein Z517_09249 [Fonsecaea pedrosoi CBS 271.37]